MSNIDPLARLRAMTTQEVAEWTAGWCEGTGNRILGELESKRRQDRDGAVGGWVAIAISIVALIVSALSLYFRWAP